MSLKCRCGAAKNDLAHRLGFCPLTKELRDKYLPQEAVALLSDTSSRFAHGMQLAPEFHTGAPKGMGHQNPTLWSAEPTTIAETLSGEVYTDGSCFP